MSSENQIDKRLRRGVDQSVSETEGRRVPILYERLLSIKQDAEVLYQKAGEEGSLKNSGQQIMGSLEQIGSSKRLLTFLLPQEAEFGFKIYSIVDFEGRFHIYDPAFKTNRWNFRLREQSPAGERFIDVTPNPRQSSEDVDMVDHNMAKAVVKQLDNFLNRTPNLKLKLGHRLLQEKGWGSWEDLHGHPQPPEYEIHDYSKLYPVPPQEKQAPIPDGLRMIRKLSYGVLDKETEFRLRNGKWIIDIEGQELEYLLTTEEPNQRVVVNLLRNNEPVSFKFWQADKHEIYIENIFCPLDRGFNLSIGFPAPAQVLRAEVIMPGGMKPLTIGQPYTEEELGGFNVRSSAGFFGLDNTKTYRVIPTGQTIAVYEYGVSGKLVTNSRDGQGIVIELPTSSNAQVSFYRRQSSRFENELEVGLMGEIGNDYNGYIKSLKITLPFKFTPQWAIQEALLNPQGLKKRVEITS